MTEPPSVRPIQEAVGAGPLSKMMPRLPAHIKVVNSVWNGSGYIRRKTALYYVMQGRAEFLADGQLRLIKTHPRNRAAAHRAAKGYEDVHRPMTVDEMAHLPIIQRRRS
jgi:hypothetical protein